MVSGGGVGRIPYLLGIVVIGALNLIVFTIVCRRLLHLASLALAMLVAFAFLGTRGVVVSHLYNQTYAVATAGLLLLVFAPLGNRSTVRGRRWWQWLAASLLPMVHLVLAAATTTQLRRGALVGLVLIAIANMGLSSRLDRYPPDWTTTAAGDRFLIEHTRAGDRIVLAPPFVFTAATAAPTRDVRRIVPQPYFLETFDRAAWIRDLNACCDVYLGREEFLREPVTRRPPGDPFFSDASIEHLEFRGEPVIVARRRAP